ncbi:MAG: beta-ketoacyl synthase N-terminal-like domain-containing protein [Vicingaceae bacterium]
MKIYIGAENIISPLGTTAKENFTKISEGNSGIKQYNNVGFDNENLFLSKLATKKSFYALLSECLEAVINETQTDLISANDTLVIISTTKADIQENINAPIINATKQLKTTYQLQNEPIVISNACISGVLAMNTANNYLKAGLYQHVFVIGADVISDFVLYGFQSLFAISNEPCQPFDKHRKGISLGEGAGGVLMSVHSDVFSQTSFEFVEGTSSNDANHISGPSRTGEGLFRTVKNSMELAGVNASEIDFISAHGTGTNFNDEMESIAFDRLKMNALPLNSLKGYFGHTLGAAGLIESAICLQSLRNNLLIKSNGFDEKGTTGEINILSNNLEKEVTTILKTASGFGGCNAAAIIRKIK